jgi:hypothetical protein
MNARNLRLRLVVRLVVAGASALPCACRAAPKAPPVGRGIVHADTEVPPGAATFARPEWRVGDRFVLVRGERLRGEFRVVGVEPGAYVIDVGSGVLLRRDLDLGNLGEWTSAGQALHLLSPVDARYHWPLWVGKRWTCEFVDNTPNGVSIAMAANYRVEAFDRIEVPAGTFEALRIVRTLRLLESDRVMTRTQIVWYAPAVGAEVRQLVSDTMVDLESFERGS